MVLPPHTFPTSAPSFTAASHGRKHLNDGVGLT